MLFKQKDLEGIKSGTISLAFRKWKKLSVYAGSFVDSSIGILKIGAIKVISLEEITDDEAQAAGFKNAAGLVQLLEQQKDGLIYKIEISYHSENPETESEEEAEMDKEEFETIKLALDNLDKFSKIGKWTVKMLQAIRENPKLKAADLAVVAKKEKEWLKLNARKLRALELIISHEPGYTLSPKGEAYMNMLGM